MSDYADAARDLLSKRWAQFFSSDWWADNLLNYVVFTVLVTLVVWLTQRAREARKRRDYERWSLQILGYNDRAQSLYWEEVQRFLLSRFELWKFVKSVVSGTMIVTLRNADKAEEAGWLKIDYERRQDCPAIAGCMV